MVVANPRRLSSSITWPRWLRTSWVASIKRTAEGSRGAFSSHSQVDQLHIRHRKIVHPFGKRNQLCMAGVGGVPRFERRRGGPQDQRDAERGGSSVSDLASMVARLGVLLERSIVLLIENDQSESGKGSEDRAAWTDNDLDFAAANPLPLKMPLGRRHLAVQHGDRAKPPLESPSRLGRKADLGNQHDGASSKANDMFNRTNVDFGLAAAGDAVQRQASSTSRSRLRATMRSSA